jgi:hypothetical protein
MKRNFEEFKRDFHANVKLDMTRREIAELFQFNSGQSIYSWLKTKGIMIGFMPILVPYSKKGNKKKNIDYSDLQIDRGVIPKHENKKREVSRKG